MVIMHTEILHYETRTEKKIDGIQSRNSKKVKNRYIEQKEISYSLYYY